MTRNEKIAERMGWEILPEGRIWEFRDKERHAFNLTDIRFAKLLQAKMVADGYQFYFSQDDEHGTTATAFVLIDGKEWDEISVHLETYSPNDEPAALHALFCKVYGITDEA